MSYLQYETSDYSGHPLELYRFALNDRTYLYTSADHEITWDGEVYVPIFIRRGSFSKGGDVQKQELEIEVASTNEVAVLFRDGWVNGIMIVTILRMHHGDDAASVLWKGRVIDCAWAEDSAKLTSNNVFTLFSRPGLRRVYSLGCPHALYSDACGVVSENWKVTATVTEIDDNTITLDGISSFADGYFLGGIIRYGDARRMITAHSDGSVTAVDGFSGLVVGEGLTLLPGCKHTVNDCLNKFSNLKNYGGLPYLPDKNPFSGDAIV